jgi:hypothetical protein
MMGVAMSKKRVTKLERSIKGAHNRRSKRSPRNAFLYTDAETLKAALDNARHHNNKHRPKSE